MHTWTTTEDENSQKNATSASVPPNKGQSLQVLPTPKITSTEVATAPDSSTSEDSLLKSIPLPSETSASPEGVRKQTLTPTEKTEEGMLKLQTLALQTESTLKFSPKPCPETPQSRRGHSPHYSLCQIGHLTGPSSLLCNSGRAYNSSLGKIFLSLIRGKCMKPFDLCSLCFLL